MAILPFILASAVAFAQAASYSVIANLGNRPGRGQHSESAVVFDHTGNLFGLTYQGGAYGAGTAFELIPKQDGFWTEKTITNFRTYPPNGPLVVDAKGNLYGTQTVFSPHVQGVVFELSPSGDGSWTKTNIYSLPATSNGNFPTGVVLDKEGNLYGATSSFLSGGGTIFELSHEKDGSWTESLLYTFQDLDGVPLGLSVGPADNLYGTTQNSSCFGVVFSLTKPQSEGGSWSYTTLHTFPGLDDNNHGNPSGDAACPNSALSFDSDGNLYGTSPSGGAHNRGAVFEIPADGGANGPDKILHSFNLDAQNPYGGLVFDRSGNLYGITVNGGPYKNYYGGGKIFELLPQKNGSWSIKALHNFGGRTYNGVKGADGFSPAAGLVIGPDGGFYGTTFSGGYYPGEPGGNDNQGYGTVFKFVVH